MSLASRDPGLAVFLVTVGVVAVVVVTVPELRLFLAFALGCGALLAAVLLALGSRRPPSEVVPPRRHLGPVEINLSKVPIGGGIAGLLVVLGSLWVLMSGLTEARWFFATTLTCGVLLAAGLVRWRRTHPGPQAPENTLRQ